MSVALRRFDQEAAVAAAHVEQTAVLVERIGVQDFARHERLRVRHQRGVVGATRRRARPPQTGRRWPSRSNTATVPSASARRAANRRDRVDPRTANYDARPWPRPRDCPPARRPGFPARSVRRPLFHQAQRDGGLEQAFAWNRAGPRAAPRCPRAVSGPSASNSNSLSRTQANRICEYTKPAQRSNSARRALARRRARERKGGCPALKFRVRQPPIANGEIAVRP